MNGGRRYSTNSSASGEFLFSDLEAQSYQLTVKVNDRARNAPGPVVIQEGDILIADLEMSGLNQTVAVVTRINVATQQGSGGERLSSSTVSSLPLDERDFSKIPSASGLHNIPTRPAAPRCPDGATDRHAILLFHNGCSRRNSHGLKIRRGRDAARGLRLLLSEYLACCPPKPVY
jgi:hypothetical protein